MTVWSYLAQGDALNRLVALVLLAMSVASWVVILWRVWLLRSAVAGVQLSLPVFWQSADWADGIARLQARDPQRLVLPLV